MSADLDVLVPGPSCAVDGGHGSDRRSGAVCGTRGICGFPTEMSRLSYRILSPLRKPFRRNRRGKVRDKYKDEECARDMTI